jgi:predicted transposase/invertase (TIGR01784 family)
MQMNWTNMFLQRVLFNASKAYVTQLERGQDYKLLKPVFGLAMLDAEFDDETPEFYHDYQMVCTSGQPEKVIEGLRLVFIELPKFKAQQSAAYKPLRQAWLRFMKEVGASKDTVAQETALRELGNEAPEIKLAMELARESAYSREQLDAYDRYWDAVSTERTLITGKVQEARTAALAEGKAEGLMEGLELALKRMMDAGIGESEAAKILGMDRVKDD